MPCGWSDACADPVPASEATHNWCSVPGARYPARLRVILPTPCSAHHQFRTLNESSNHRSVSVIRVSAEHGSTKILRSRMHQSAAKKKKVLRVPTSWCGGACPDEHMRRSLLVRHHFPPPPRIGSSPQPQHPWRFQYVAAQTVSKLSLISHHGPMQTRHGTPRTYIFLYIKAGHKSALSCSHVIP